MLAQRKEDGKIHPVQFASKISSSSGKEYATCDRENLIVVFALKKFRVHLLPSIPFTAISDHQALRSTFQK